MPKLIFFLIAALILIASPINLSAQETTDESPKEIAARLQQRYDEMKSYTLNFHQDTRGEMTGKARKGSGRASFLRDEMVSKMRWDYTHPDKQVLVSDGKQFSMYFANLQQMIISPAETLDADLTYSFFTGRGNLIEDFQIFPPDDNLRTADESGTQSIKLIPNTPQSQVQDIHLWVSADSLLRRIHIRDHFGTITVLNFSDIRVNSLTGKSPEQLEELFSFTPPDDTEIIFQK